MVTLTLTITAILSIIVGLVILIWPKALNYVVALWFLLYGTLQLISAYL